MATPPFTWSTGGANRGRTVASSEGLGHGRPSVYDFGVGNARAVAVLVGSIAAVAFVVPFARADEHVYTACTSAPTEAQRKGARGAYAAGEASFREGDYRTAVASFRDAYRRDCTAHALLLDIARANELLGDRTTAAAELELFLARVPNDREAPALRRRIAVLRASAAAAPSASSAPVASAASRWEEPLAAPPAPAPAASPAAAVAVSSPASSSRDDTTSPDRSRTLGWVLAVGGGVATVAGVGLFADGRAMIDDAEAACPARTGCTPDAADEGNRGRTLRTAGAGLAGAGLGAAGIGLWMLLDGGSAKAASTSRAGTADSAATLWVAPELDRHAAGVRLGTTF